MAITTKAQTVEVSGVTKIVVSNRAEDPNDGDQVREIRVICGDDEEAPTFVLRVKGEDAESIKVTAPEQDF